MRNPLSDKITNIKPSGIRKFFDIVSEMEDAISLGVGEPDFDTPWHIRDEGIYSLEKGKTFYTSNAGLKEISSSSINRNTGYRGWFGGHRPCASLHVKSRRRSNHSHTLLCFV